MKKRKHKGINKINSKETNWYIHGPWAQASPSYTQTPSGCNCRFLSNYAWIASYRTQSSPTAQMRRTMTLLGRRTGRSSVVGLQRWTTVLQSLVGPEGQRWNDPIQIELTSPCLCVFLSACLRICAWERVEKLGNGC
jgi:hypothetical protein